MEPEFLRGFVRRLRVRATREVHAFVFYSSKLPQEWQRVVICKELTHLTNHHAATARTRAEVSELIRELTTSGKVQSLPGVIDIVGILHGLCILFPRDGANILRAKHAAGQITEAKIAKETRVPAEIVPLLLSPEWRAILESID